MNETLAAEPLSRFRWFRTSDFDEARVQVGRQFRDHVLHSIGPMRGLDTIQNSVRLDTVSLHYLDYGASVRVRADALNSFYLVVIPLDGSAKFLCGGVETVCDQANAAIFSASRNFQFDWRSNCRSLIVRIERDAMDRKLASYIGSTPRFPIEFQPRLPTGSGCGMLFEDTIVALTRQLDDADTLRFNPILRGEVEQFLLGILLQDHDHSHSRLLQAAAELAPQSALLAAEYIEAHAGRAVTLEDLARAAGVSGRALQQSFQRHYGLSPMKFLRQVRLMKVREDLEQTDPDSGITVTGIALKWGFSHLGRFSGAYQRRFGEPPSATLRR